MSCIFCSIVAGDAPADIVFSNEEFLIFCAKPGYSKHHYLVVPKNHCDNFAVAEPDVFHKAIDLAKTFAKNKNIWPYVLSANFGAPLQTIFHAHLHLCDKKSSESF